MRKLLYLFVTVSFCQFARAQTLFTYGPYKVSKAEFLRAWERNNPHVPAADRIASLKAYLDLYVNYRLKVRAARDAGLDKNKQLDADVLAFQKQLADQFMNRLVGLPALRAEALQRSQTDVELSQVFVGFTGADTAAAYNKIAAALRQLKQGVAFDQVAATYSTDVTVQQAGGRIGFVTVFILPYAVENIAYGLTPGQYSGIYRSGSGYHIFKCLSQRPDPGTFKGAHILLAVPPGADAAGRAAVAARAQNVHDQLVRGASFDSLVLEYTNDKMTYATKGELPDFTVGRFDPEFEQAAFGLQKDGDISGVVETANGYHIIKRGSLVPPVKDSTDTRLWYELQQHTLYSDRMQVAKTAFAQRILPVIGYHVGTVDDAWLFRTADTVLHHNDVETYLRNLPLKTLFSFNKQVYTTHDWFHYLYYKKRYQLEKSNAEIFKGFVEEFTQVRALEYYTEHLAQYNSDFRLQLEEYVEGNLFFESMQQNVWNKAGEDAAALEKLYEQHAGKYLWGPSIDAVIVNSTDSVAIASFLDKVQKAPATWRIQAAAFKAVAADSIRMEQAVLKDIPLRVGKTRMISQPDGSLVAYYIFSIHNDVLLRNFSDARGLLVNDNQIILEQKWLAALRKKYPVKLNLQLLQ